MEYVNLIDQNTLTCNVLGEVSLAPQQWTRTWIIFGLKSGSGERLEEQVILYLLVIKKTSVHVPAESKATIRDMVDIYAWSIAAVTWPMIPTSFIVTHSHIEQNHPSIYIKINFTSSWSNPVAGSSKVTHPQCSSLYRHASSTLQALKKCDTSVQRQGWSVQGAGSQVTKTVCMNDV